MGGKSARDRTDANLYEIRIRRLHEIWPDLEVRPAGGSL